MKRFNRLLQIVLLVVGFAAVTLPAYGQDTQGSNGQTYAITFQGGYAYCGGISGYDCGEIYNVSTSSRLYKFCSYQTCGDGWQPQAPMLLGPDGNFYGTTMFGGNGGLCSNGGNGCGTIWEFNPVYNTLSQLYVFCLTGSGCTDGAYPVGGLIQGPYNVLYGVTSAGGAYDRGEVFSIQTATGVPQPQTLITLYSFTGGSDGGDPNGGLTLDSNGNIHGTTYEGGTYGKGTAFVITPSGQLQSSTPFGAPKGGGTGPNGGMTGDTKGNFFGTTYAGGLHNNGTVFKISASGAMKNVFSFDEKNGANPMAGLIRGTDGNFYGTASAGGAYKQGTAFKISPEGKLTTLKSFNGTDGSTPTALLMQNTNGDFYGGTFKGGANGEGAMFKLSEGLRPFVETLPTFGPVGSSVMILGTNLAGTSRVLFNGVAAKFEMVSKTEIATSVPSGATSGTVEVLSRSGKLLSNVPFQVTSNGCNSGSNVMIYSNLGSSTDAFDYTNGWLISGPSSPLGNQQWIGYPFTATESHTATEIDAAVFYYGADGQAGNNFNFGIWSDASGVPGTELNGTDVSNLSTWTGTSGDCCNTQNAIIAATPLTAGTQYWVVLSTDGNGLNSLGVWDNVYNDAVGSQAYNVGSGWITEQVTTSAFAVCGSN